MSALAALCFGAGVAVLTARWWPRAQARPWAVVEDHRAPRTLH